MTEVILQVYLQVIQIQAIQMKVQQAIQLRLTLVMILNQIVVDSQSFHLLKVKWRRLRKKEGTERKRFQPGRKNNQKLHNDKIAYVYHHHLFISCNNLSSSCPHCSYLLNFRLSALGCFSWVLTSSYFHF